MGACHPIRSVHDSPLHVDRPLLHRGSVPLSNRGGAADFFAAGHRRNYHCRRFVFCFSRCVLLSRALTLADGSARSSIGFAEWTCHLIFSRHCTPRCCCFWSMFTQEIFAAFCCGQSFRGSSLLLFRHCSLTSTTSSTSSVVLSWPDIASTFFRESSHAPPVVANRRIGLYYAAGAAVVLIMGAIFWPWGVLLLWPAIALGIVAIAYFRAGPIVFHKTEGKLPWSTRFVLAPCLLGQYLSLLYYRSQCRSWDKVTPQIWIGGKLGCRSANKALCSGVVSVLDLSAEFSEAKPFRKINYRNIPVLDLTAPTQAQLVEMSKFIGNHSRNGAVYVHCKIGYSRSAAAVAAYLIMSGKVKTAEEAFAMIRRVRPSVVIRPEVRSALSEFEHRVRSSPGGTDSFVLALDHGAFS